ncbi:MAG: ATP-binding protein [Porticoccaceae bacterium]|nr:ATP-binding protein [Porticoccaceae bacterium]
MPKKFFKQYLPSPKHHAEHRALKWLGPLVKDPYLFHLNRHSVSLAFFVGIFSAFIPVPGQTIIAALLALLVRCNLPLSVILIWITNPLTMTPIFILTHQLGSWILGSPPIDFHVHMTWEWFNEQGKSLLLPLLLGSLLTGLILGALGYLAIQGLWRWTVVRNWRARRRARQATPDPFEQPRNRR